MKQTRNNFKVAIDLIYILEPTYAIAPEVKQNFLFHYIFMGVVTREMRYDR